MVKVKELKQDGAVLLVVLLIVMAITILSLGFLSRSDVELACGQNMILHEKMDYLAESGMEQARGLILNPQDIGCEYWTGDVAQQLVPGSDDYYDVNVVKLGECNYQITSQGYRIQSGEKIGCSNLKTEVRLDPCIVFWVGQGMTISDRTTINGDVCCNGDLANRGVINGDVFADSVSGAVAGQTKATGDLSLHWPALTPESFTSHYAVQTVGSSLSGVTFGPYEPVRICHHSGNLELTGNVHIEGMLLVEGDLIISGSGNVITAAKNLPAFLVTGDVIVKENGRIDLSGLGVVNGDMRVSAGGARVNILGGLFVQGAFEQTTVDSSGQDHTGAFYNGPTWRTAGGHTGGAVEFDGLDDKIEDRDAGSYLNGLSAVTASMWVKSNVTGRDRGILFTRNPTSADEELGIRYDAGGAVGGGTNCIKASVCAGWSYTQIESSLDVQTTQWQHLALVWQSGSSLKLYINGQLNLLSYDRGSVSGTVNGVQKLMLGCGTKGRYWDGLIDDVRIYNRALDPNANEIYPPVDGLPGLVGHWKLDESGADISITAAPLKTAIVFWSETGLPQKWSTAASAFYRSIERH